MILVFWPLQTAEFWAVRKGVLSPELVGQLHGTRVPIVFDFRGSSFCQISEDPVSTTTLLNA